MSAQTNRNARRNTEESSNGHDDVKGGGDRLNSRPSSSHKLNNGKEATIKNAILLRLKNMKDPDLTPEEELLPKAEKELRITLKKLNTLDLYKEMDAETVAHFARNEDANYEGKEGEVLFQYGDTPQLFSLMWFGNSDKAYLINRWLTDNEDALVNFSTLEETVGRTVAALYGSDGYWYRGICLSLEDDGRTVRVEFIDFGNQDSVPLNFIKELPKPLVSLHPLCFPAGLHNIIPEGLEGPIEWDVKTRVNFLKAMDQEDFLYAHVKDYDSSKNIWQVDLLCGPKPMSEINATIRHMLSKKRTIPEVMQEKAPQLELDKMLHLDREVNIAAYRELSLKGLRNYRVSYITSPTDFSVEFVSTLVAKMGGTSEESVEPWQTEMQAFYNAEENAQQFKLLTANLYNGRCYVWKNPKTLRWERVRVTSVDIAKRICQIHVMDVGYFTMASYDDMFELCVQFATASASTCSGYLVDIVPRDGKQAWPEKSVEAFRRLTHGKIFNGIVITRETVRHGEHVSVIRIGLMLMDRDKNANYTLNAHLCALGLASANGLAGGRNDLSSQVGGTPCFDPDMFKAHQEKTGQEFIPSLPVKEALADNLKPPTPTTPEGTTKKGKWSLDPDMNRSGLNLKDEIPDDLEHVPSVIRKRLGICNICKVISPGCFYLQLTEKLSELKQMNANIQKQVEFDDLLSDEELYDGAIIACRATDEEASTSGWNRAIIKQHLPKIKMIKVILIDSGLEVRTRRELCRALPPYFFTIPGFCQRVHLDATNLNPLGSMSWSLGAREAFRRYLNSWEQEIPVYYTWQPRNSSIIELDEFDHEVRFNTELQKWEKGIAHNIPQEKPISKVKDHVIMRNLFCSVGVDIAYEIFTKPYEAYKFASIWDLLKQKGFAVIRKTDQRRIGPQEEENLNTGTIGGIVEKDKEEPKEAKFPAKVIE